MLEFLTAVKALNITMVQVFVPGNAITRFERVTAGLEIDISSVVTT